MNKNAQTIMGWFGGAALLIGMPLLGVRLAGGPLAPYLEMPPRTDFVTHAPFSWPVFLGLALFIVIVIMPFVLKIISGLRIANSIPTTDDTEVVPPLSNTGLPPRFLEGRAPSRPFLWKLCKRSMYLGRRDSNITAAHFPYWGWLAIFFGLSAWTLAWTRFAWFKPFQPFTFTPLWLAYIVVMNALAFRRTGRSPLTHQTGAFLALFPLSALFWWFFEYLNRFVQNWHYLGIGALTAEEYFLRATLPFATVLPAFVATRAWLAGYPKGWIGLADWKPFTTYNPRRLACLALTVAALGLAGIGIWHEFLFPLLWVAPLIVIASLQTLSGKTTLLADPARGDWRRLVMAAVTALICGFFWEMWNVLSLEKWIYTVPFVARFHIFEMPLLGYAGYLPFGIECALMAELVGLTGEETAREYIAV